jgi:hypothetical protein
LTPSITPTETPTRTASNTPSVTPTRTPSLTPSITPTQTPSRTPSETPTFAAHENTAGDFGCTDLFDNDDDGMIDCADPDCAAVFPCSNIAPTMSTPMTGILAATLALVGLLGVSRARRRSGD